MDITLTPAQQATIDTLAGLYRGDGHLPEFTVRNLRDEIAEFGTVDAAAAPSDAVIVFRDWEDDEFRGEHLVPDEGLMLDADGGPVQL